MSLQEDYRICERKLKSGSKSFYAASLLLPRSVREQAIALYAFCRSSDDAVDHDVHNASGGRDHGGLGSSRFAVHRIHERLEAIYCGSPKDYPEDRTFAHLVEKLGLPKPLPLALIEGYQWDAEGRTYANIEALLAYCVRVAGTVGLMMAWIMGVREREVFACACELGVAMQLTNISRDVGEDARAGRVYLPQDWLRQAGIDAIQFRLQPKMSEALGSVIEKILKEADVHYARGESGLRYLPLDCQTAMWTARYVYAAIGEDIRRHRYNSVDRRAFVSTPKKIRWAMRARHAAKLSRHQPENLNGSMSMTRGADLIDAIVP